jgi:hypothetical protein
MQMVHGKVVNGRIVLDGPPLPEGTLVTVCVKEAEDSVQLSPSDEAELMASIEEADRDEGGISVEELAERLRKYG